MISISATTYDPVGTIVLKTRLDNAFQAERRGSVVETLDGGVAVYDAGYSESGKTLTATLSNPNIDQVKTLRYLIAYYTDLVLCCESGAFSARISFALNKSVLALSIRILSRIDA